MPTPLTVATVNVNGIRAAVRRGMCSWLAERDPDVLCLQEVRAPDEVLCEILTDALGDGWHIAHCEPTDTGTKGRAGVAVATRLPVGEQRACLDPRFDGAGRWVELDVDTPAGTVTVVSVYVHTGEADTPKQDDKYAFLKAMTARMAELRDAGRPALVCGDFNIAHRNEDIRNWKGNLKKAGFLPEERAHYDHWFDELGWVDVVRSLHPGVDGPYSWWSWRGQAFDKDTGWRIDLQLATPELAALAGEAVVDRAASYAERFSDHAPVVVAYG
ncbi:exodeoxyribonuclease-3 [Kineococcus xinjiangensis]|uniref:Exodeoxyribonuclease-3 n=1 Tax=Kineococcus xinjiangensis TaxID=512762 RepID=A0A2S6ITS2_9ACTN|nr:exodeoxyribonuclease III [Kineococcus xinjiangensis]PPK97652.1 exodeoxyribonuclease-3 [Kineococcus xinjiangensis]